MESGSFGALAAATTLGLLADQVALALEAMGGKPGGGAVPPGSRDVLGEAADFLNRALEAKARPSGEVTWENVRSQQAYQKAMQAATTASRLRVAVDAPADKEIVEVLQRVATTLALMRDGQPVEPPDQVLTEGFFLALSAMATADHNRISLRSVVRWGKETAEHGSATS